MAKKKSLAEVAEEKGPDPAEVQHLKAEIRRLHKKLNRQQGSTEAMVSSVVSILSDLPPVPIPPKPKASRKKQREYALLHLSDFQAGAASPNFNTEILRERIIDRMLPKVRKIIEARRSAARLDDIHIALGGDQVDGSNLRANQAWEVCEDVMQQSMVTAPEIQVQAIQDVMSYFPNVEVSSVAGNHGRSGPFKRDANPDRVNWDNVCAMATKQRLQPHIDKGRLKFHVEVDDFMHVFQIGGARVMSVHGHQFRGGGGFAGIPLYAIARLVAKWAISLPPEQQFDIVIMGHFHQSVQWTFGPKQIYINGSPQTGSAFVKEVIGSENRPAQRLLIFNDELPYPIADHILYLD